MTTSTTATPAAIVVVADHGGGCKPPRARRPDRRRCTEQDTAVGIRRLALAELEAITVCLCRPRHPFCHWRLAPRYWRRPCRLPTVAVRHSVQTVTDHPWAKKSGSSEKAQFPGDGSFKTPVAGRQRLLAIGADGIARTASTPYPGLSRPGEYVVVLWYDGCRRCCHRPYRYSDDLTAESLTMSGTWQGRFSGSAPWDRCFLFGFTVGTYRRGVPPPLTLRCPP